MTQPAFQEASERSFEDFLEELSSTGRHRELQRAKGVVAFELIEDQRAKVVHVKLDDGVVSIPTPTAHVDTVVRASRESFDAIAQGKMNAMAAMLRGAVVVEGDLGLLATLVRVFPSLPARQAIQSKRRSANG